MTAIVTVTLNAALDRTLLAPGFAVGRSQTARTVIAQGGGKGINVARALHLLGQPVLALGLAGGAVGEMIRRALDEEGLPHDLTPFAGQSRLCTAIVDPAAGATTEVNDPGPTIDADAAHAFLVRFAQALPTTRLVVLSGSLPPGLPDDFYATLIGQARAAGVPAMLDTRGSALRAALAAGPLIIKPNQHEAAELLGAVGAGQEAAAARRLLGRPGPLAVAITLGAAGAILATEAGAWQAVPPPLRALSTVGAGDCFVAGLIAALPPWRDERSLADALADTGVLAAMLRTATATAAASTLTLGAGRFDEATRRRLLPDVRITGPNASGSRA